QAALGWLGATLGSRGRPSRLKIMFEAKITQSTIDRVRSIIHERFVSAHSCAVLVVPNACNCEVRRHKEAKVWIRKR
ncbi:MAG TPA: hypothetical protein VKO35_06200, partial [Acidimicrobiia bacterium]|nr:hypothetical protein [Acidimicrobiia bacterium]